MQVISHDGALYILVKRKKMHIDIPAFVRTLSLSRRISQFYASRPCHGCTTS